MFFEHFLAHRGVGFWTPVFDRSQRFRFIVRYEKGIDAHDDDDDWRTKRLLLLFLSCFTTRSNSLSRPTQSDFVACASSRRRPKKVYNREHHHHRRRYHTHTHTKALGQCAAALLLLLFSRVSLSEMMLPKQSALLSRGTKHKQREREKKEPKLLLKP